jgi:hypothetical protein
MTTRGRNLLAAAMCVVLLIGGCATAAAPGLHRSGGGAASQPDAPAGKYTLTINDAHCHFVNFLQESDGMASLFAVLEEAQVNHIVLFGLPVVKKWDAADGRKPTYYNDNDSKAYYYGLTDVILARAIGKLPAEQARRVHPMICGFNPTDKNAIDHVRRMIEWYPDLWQGIGEILTRHDDLTRMTQEETSRADHPALKAVYELAAERDLPVWVHSNIGTVGLEDPIYLEEMRNAVRDNPRTRFVWCHVGYSRNLKIPTLAQVADDMLNKYPNLWVDLSWVVYESVVAPGGKVDPRWVALIEKYPGRFLIGSDKIGKWATYKAEIRKYEPLLKALKPAVAQAVCADNLWKVLPARVSQPAKATAGR